MRSANAFSGIEVNGALLEGHVKAFRLFPRAALPLLAKHGIGIVRPDGEIVVDYKRWYPVAAWLDAFDAVMQNVGPNTVFEIGQEVPRYAALPPNVKDIHASIRAVDVGYHMNHAKEGRVMFDTMTGQMSEGIGHYGYATKAGQRLIQSVCENPYPCVFDRGILTAFARKFEAGAVVNHVSGAPCRAHGGKTCTYDITW